jgi:hypothetical protein
MAKLALERSIHSSSRVRVQFPALLFPLLDCFANLVVVLTVMHRHSSFVSPLNRLIQSRDLRRTLERELLNQK